MLTQQEVSQHCCKMALSARRRLHFIDLFQDSSEYLEDENVVGEHFASVTRSDRAQQTRKGRRRQRQAPLASMTMYATGEARNNCKPNMSIQIPVELP